MNVLITGGKGFIGSHLANKLALNQNNKIYVLDNLSSPSKNTLKKNVDFIYGDVSNKILINNILIKKKIDLVYHLAAKINESVIKENQIKDIESSIISTINILEILKKFPKKKLIFGSSVAVYGKSKNFAFNENSPNNPEFSYSISKKTAENYIKYYQKYYGIKASIIRIGNVYGPYQPKIGEVGVINIFIKNLIKKKPLTIYGTGNQKRDFIFIEDVVDFLIFIEKKIGTYNLASGKSYTINNLAQILSKKKKIVKNY